MPHTHSAKKELRKSVKRRAQNDQRKNLIKSLRKEVRFLVLNKKTDDAKALLSKLYKAADKAVKTHAVHKNKADRIKSRAAQFILKNK